MTSNPDPIVIPDRKGLREFGLVTGGLIAALFGIVFPWMLERPWPLWPWIVFGALGGTGLVAPLTLRRIYYWWMRFALLLSKITTPIIMAIVYYIVVTPMGIVMRMFRKDTMMRAADDSQVSYRVILKPSRDKSNLERPF